MRRASPCRTKLISFVRVAPDFSNIIPRTDIKILAESDEGESVQDFKEIYADYLPVNPNLFSLHIPTCLQALSWNPEALERSTQGLVSVLLSFKFRPAIRYRAGSTAAQTLAKKVHETISNVVDCDPSRNYPRSTKGSEVRSGAVGENLC